MSEQTLGPQATPRPASGAPQLPGEEAVIPRTPEGSAKPPLPESAEVLLASAAPNTVKEGAPETAAAGAPEPPAPPTAADEPGFNFGAFSAEQRTQL